jgi:hypothetical protein
MQTVMGVQMLSSSLDALGRSMVEGSDTSFLDVLTQMLPAILMLIGPLTQVIGLIKAKTVATIADNIQAKLGIALDKASFAEKTKALVLAAKEKIANAWSAAAKAANAVANIPYVGPFLAVAAAGAVLGALGLAINAISNKIQAAKKEEEEKQQNEANKQALEAQKSIRDLSKAALEESASLEPLIDNLKKYAEAGKSVPS